MNHTRLQPEASLRIRALRKGDVRACAELVAATPLWQRYRYDEKRCARDLGKALKRRDLINLAVSGSSILGLAWVLPRGGFGRIPYLKLLAVREGARGHGVGAKLLRASHPSGDLLLMVSDFNRRARRFYAAQGYERVGAIKGLVLEGVTEIVMFKRTGRPDSGRDAERLRPDSGRDAERLQPDSGRDAGAPSARLRQGRRSY